MTGYIADYQATKNGSAQRKPPVDDGQHGEGSVMGFSSPATNL